MTDETILSRFSWVQHVFTSERQAKRFFVARIALQAERERVLLSETERQLLLWEPAFEVSERPTLRDSLHAEMSDEDYEAKIAGLIERAWKQDVAIDSNARREYLDAFKVLSRGDHYLLVMIRRAIGEELRPWWAIWRRKSF